MAQFELMDVDSLASDFDDKENSLQHSNVLKTPSTEKGYEELDVSELNMKLRYSITPANSPMSRSYTTSCKGDSGPNSLNNTDNLTQSLNSTVTKCDILKSPKLPLQALPASLYTYSDRRSCDREGIENVKITGTDNDDNLSIPSISSSAVQTPEATTPTKEIPKSDGSPIMRGLKSVLNMFRSSHSPVPPLEDNPSDENLSDNTLDKDGGQSNPQLSLVTTPICHDSTPVKDGQSNHLLASTPISHSKMIDTSKRNSPLKDSVVFKDGLERELQWQDESEIYFKHEKIPIHKLLFQTGQLNVDPNTKLSKENNDTTNLNTTVEYMDVSNAEVSYKSVIENKTNDFDSRVNHEMSGVESDNEFVDCETTYLQNKSYILETVQESKTSPVVFQIDNVTHEACLEDYIEPTNVSDKVDKDKIPSDEIISEPLLPKFGAYNEADPVTGINDLTSENHSYHPNDLPGCSEVFIKNVSYSPLQDTNKTFNSVEITNMPSELFIKDHVNHVGNLNIIEDNPKHADDINNGNIIDSVISANTSINTLNLDKVYEEMQHLTQTNNFNLENDVKPTQITNNFQNISEYTVATSPSYTQQSVKDNEKLQMITQTNNLVHELCTKNDIKDNQNYKIEVPGNIVNQPISTMILKAEDVINLDTDDMNTARILFDIDALILNQVKTNNEKDVSNFIENTIECSKALEVSNSNVFNITEDNILSKSRAFDDAVVIRNNETNDTNLIKSVGINYISNLIEQLNENTLVSGENVSADNNNTLDTIIKKETAPIDNIKLQNMSLNKTYESQNNLHMNDDNSLSLSDTEEIINIMEYSVNMVNDVVNSEINFENSEFDEVKIYNKFGFNLKNSDDHLDITMDTSEPNLHHPPCETISDIHKELKNDPPTKLPLPLDVPLPNDDDNERENSFDSCFLKNNNDVGVISEIETEKLPCIKNDSNSDCKKIVEHSILSNPSQMLKETVSNISHSEVFDIHDKKQTNSVIQETPFFQLTTNVATCLQELNGDSFIKEEKPIPSKPNEPGSLNETFTSSAIVNQRELNVDIKPMATSLPDVVQAVNDTPEKYDSNTHGTKREITNEAICLDDIRTDVINDVIVTYANNSPYVSVTELDFNSSSNVLVKLNDKVIQSQIKPTASPPISPKCIRKGYNINFDEIENPFATKNNVRMSPPPGEVLPETYIPQNNNQKNEIIVQRRPPIRRMSQPDGKKTDMNKKRFNKSIDIVKITNSNNAKKISSNVVNTVHTDDNETGQDKINYGINPLASNEENLRKEINSEVDYADNALVSKISPELENVTEFNTLNETIALPEQNFNNDNSESRSVFNIPEIEDINFNPFATKSRVCASPPLTMELKDPLMAVNNIEIITESKNISDQKKATVCIEDSVQLEVQVSPVKSTSSSINTDKNITVREVNTEDEDTIEGPFFEAEDLVDVGKLPNIIDTMQIVEKDTMQFEDVPATSTNEDKEKGELFIDAEAFEFLLNQNKSNVVADSGKESLFLKFDPLFAKRVSSDGVLAALSSIQKRQSTPKKMTRAPLVNIAQEETPMMSMAGSSNVVSIPEESNAEIVSTISKPMMVVNPAVAKQPVATPRISLTPRTNRQSLNFMSPAMVVIDRLLSLSGNTSLSDEEVTMAAANRNHDANIVLVQLRELLAEKDLHVHSLKSESKELRCRLTTLESQVKSLETEGAERLKKVNNLNQRLTEQTKCNRSMALVVEEYERTIATLIAEMEQEKKRNAEERMRLICERDEQTAHLASMEGSFSDLNSKYEKCKQIILSMKTNEDAYKKSLKEFDENLLKMQKNYDLLKQHATSKLNHANQELEKINKAHDADVLKLKAMIKRKELHITSLEESLSQKKKAIEELTAICDELINKVG